MALTKEQRAELKALAEECAMSISDMTDAQFRRVSTAAREAIPALLADLEEAERKAQLPVKYRRMQFNAELQEELATVRQQLAEAQARRND